MNNLAVASALLFEPRKAFDEIGRQPRFWFPLLALILSSVALVIWYYSIVDVAWLTDKTIRGSAFASSLSEAQIEERVQAAAANRGVNTAFAAIATGLFIGIILLFSALYYALAGKITNVERSFRQWLALSSWTSLPGALAAIPAAFVLLTTTTTQITQADMQPLSLNALFFQRSMEQPGYTLLTSINLLQLASLYLAAVAVKQWSGRSWLFSIVFTTLPFVLIYGIWAYFSLGRS